MVNGESQYQYHQDPIRSIPPQNQDYNTKSSILVLALDHVYTRTQEIIFPFDLLRESDLPRFYTVF